MICLMGVFGIILSALELTYRTLVQSCHQVASFLPSLIHSVKPWLYTCRSTLSRLSLKVLTYAHT